MTVKKWLITCLYLFGLTTLSLQAAQFMIGAHAGQALFSKSFKNAFTVGTKLSFAAREGLVIEGSANYMDVETKASETKGKAFKGTVVLGHINYMVPIRAKIQPYIGGAAGVALIGSKYNSPAFTYAGTLGFFINLARDSKMYIEATQMMIDSGDIDVDISPIAVKVGVGVAFGHNKKGKRKELKAGRKRKFNPVRRRPKGPRSRRNMRRGNR
ncbi:hypothetical protein OAJ27_00820 [bacterium]|nr:hypothetical protein [bacterium]